MTAYVTAPIDPTKVVGRRILAYGIDTLLMAAVVIAVLYPQFRSLSEVVPSSQYRCASTPAFGDGADDKRLIDSTVCLDDGVEVRYIPEDEDSAFTGKIYGIGFGLQALNLVLLQSLVGASIGKLIVGLRVVRPDGRKAGIGWMALRWVLLPIDSFCCFLPGAVMVFSTKGHRRLGDMAATTYVVSRSSVGQPVVLPHEVPAGGYVNAGYAPAPTGEGPTWDDARNTYIQFDRNQGAWVQWDANASAWKPIDQ